MFKPVPSEYSPVLHEEQILNFWKLRRLFAKSAGLNEGSAEFVLYEDPPSANRRPDVLDEIGRALKEKGISLEELLDRGREIRGELVEDEYDLRNTSAE